jgi:hypothetical protein
MLPSGTLTANPAGSPNVRQVITGATTSMPVIRKPSANVVGRTEPAADQGRRDDSLSSGEAPSE